MEDHNIGTQSEGSLHAALKLHVSQPGDRFEVPMRGFVVDVVRGDTLIEVQTGGFASMGRKLDHLLADYHAAIGGTPPERVVGVWLIANSLFQRGVGACRYRDIALVDGTDAVTPVPIG